MNTPSDATKSSTQDISGQVTSRVSIVVPAYNYDKFVGQCVESALKQDFGDLEVIVVENGSTDGTRAVLRTFSDPRLRVIELDQNIGWNGAIKLGFEQSRGDMVMLLSSDDYLTTRHISTLVDYLDSHPEIAGVGTWIQVVDAMGRPTPQEEESYKITVNMVWDPDDMEMWAVDHHFQLPTALFRRTNLAPAFPEPGSDRSGDWALHVAIMRHGGRLAVIHERLFCLRLHGSNLSNPDTLKRVLMETTYWMRNLFAPTCEIHQQPKATTLAARRLLRMMGGAGFSENEIAFAARYIFSQTWKGTLLEYIEASHTYVPVSAEDFFWIGLARHCLDEGAIHKEIHRLRTDEEHYQYVIAQKQLEVDTLRRDEEILRRDLETSSKDHAETLNHFRELSGLYEKVVADRDSEVKVSRERKKRIQKLKANLVRSEKIRQRLKDAILQWNNHSWITRALHKIRIKDLI